MLLLIGLTACNPNVVISGDDTGTDCTQCSGDTDTDTDTGGDIDPNDVDNDGDGFTEHEGDCNDANDDVSPVADEVCGDGVDQNCSGGDAACDDTGTDNPNDGEGNLAVVVDYPWGDGDVVCLDYEVVTDRAYLGTISGDAWEDAGGCVVVVDGKATWYLDVGYNMDAVRYDVDFPSGGNICEGYDTTAHNLVDSGVTYGTATWSVGSYSMSWDDGGVTYYGCSAVAYAP